MTKILIIQIMILLLGFSFSPEELFSNNSLSSFRYFNKPKIRVLLIANSDYLKRKLKLPLTLNDLVIYNALFKNVFGVKDSLIFEHKNLTVSGFREKIIAFGKTVKEDELVFIVYTGHGNSKGIPKFIKGNSPSPSEFYSLINKSFDNDTVLLMDCCYSGGIEGKKNLPGFEKNTNTGFRKNVLRFYSSLSTQRSEGSSYFLYRKFHKYFDSTYGFLKTMGVSKKQNSLFTLLIASFFAEYRFEKVESISFDSLYSHISSKISLMEQEGLILQRPIMYPFTEKPFKKNYVFFHRNSKLAQASSKEFRFEEACDKESKGQYQQAIKIFTGLKGYKNSSSHLAHCYIRLGLKNYNTNTDKAIIYFEKALSYDKNSFYAHNYLGSVHLSLRNFETALNEFIKVKNLAFKQKNNFWLSIAYNNMGLAYKKLNKDNDALIYYHFALDIRLKIFGDNHKVTAITYNNIGAIYYKMKEYQKAERYMTKAVKILENKLPQNHPDLIASYIWLSKIYLAQKNSKKAGYYLSKVKKIR